MLTLRNPPLPVLFFSLKLQYEPQIGIANVSFRLIMAGAGHAWTSVLAINPDLSEELHLAPCRQVSLSSPVTSVFLCFTVLLNWVPGTVIHKDLWWWAEAQNDFLCLNLESRRQMITSLIELNTEGRLWFSLYTVFVFTPKRWEFWQPPKYQTSVFLILSHFYACATSRKWTRETRLQGSKLTPENKTGRWRGERLHLKGKLEKRIKGSHEGEESVESCSWANTRTKLGSVAHLVNK